MLRDTAETGKRPERLLLQGDEQAHKVAQAVSDRLHPDQGRRSLRVRVSVQGGGSARRQLPAVRQCSGVSLEAPEAIC